MATDFGSYLLASMTPEQQEAYLAAAVAQGTVQAPALWSGYGTNAAGGRYNPGQAPLPASDPESFQYQRAHGPTSKNPDAYDPTTELGRRAAAAGYQGLDPERSLLAQNSTAIANQNAQAEIYLAQLAEQARQTRADNQAALDRSNSLIDAQDPRNAAYIQQQQALVDQLGGYRNTANQGSLDALGTYTSGLNALNARNDAAIGNLNDVYGQLRDPIQANLVSQAAIADPQALAAQNQALSMLGGTANGALDYQSQAAGAYADPKYVAMRDMGLEDLYAVSKGSKDVHVGQEDPAAYAKAMEALDKASALTNPAVSDAERFLYEQARQGWEMDQRGLDAAKMSNLRRRGMAGSGAELTQNALGSQQIAQQRVLSDLAASAQAVARSTDMLKLQGALGTQLNSEANALATGNANRQLQALGMFEQGAETAQQSSFDQAYKRGVAADNASANNQATRLSGQVAYGNQANAMQDDAYNRGLAADNMAQYNKTFEQQERDALWGRTTDVTGMTLNANAQNSNNLSNIFQGTTSVLNNNYVRDRDVVGAQGGVIAQQRQDDQTALNQRLGVQGAQIGVNNTAQNVQGNITGAQIAQSQFQLPQILQNNAVALGGAAANKAAMEAALAANKEQHRADSTGIFGLPVIGSRNGLLGGFGIGQPSEEEDAAAIRAKYGA